MKSMKAGIPVKVIGLALAALSLAGGCTTTDPGPAEAEADNWVPKIDKVFFAQHHVNEPGDELFKLVGNLASLIKVQVYSDDPRPSPDVVVILELGRKLHEFTLTGPAMLPKPYMGEPKLMPHSYEDSFTGIIPREWIKPGLKVAVELRAYNYRYKYNPAGHTGVTVFDRKEIDSIPVGAPSKILLTSYDIHFFEEEKGVDYAGGWEIAVADKLPIAEMQVERVRGIVFPELIMPDGTRCTSQEDYLKQTGNQRFDGESAAARHWMRALKKAGGRNYGHGVSFINVAFVDANGWGERWSLSGTTDLGRMGNFFHEFGHVFALPHWAGNKHYPYKGHMYGVRTQSASFPHAGPTWAYSLHRRAFISPSYPRKDKEGNLYHVWKKDPMQGGGHGDQGPSYMMRHFSDYSMKKMQSHVERRVLFWDEDQKAYFKWDPEKLSYSIRMDSDGWNLAEDPFAEVFSVIASASSVKPRANFVYPPIGPYKGGLLTRFDAASKKDRGTAAGFGFTDEKCDTCLRVTQGGKTATYLLEMRRDPLPGKENKAAYVTTAINLSAKDGRITKMDLLHTPDVMSKGLSASAKVLYSWKAPAEKR